MIEIKDIHKSFGVLQVLRGIDVTIKAGEIVSIVGPSGAGKTTLLQIAGTLDKPDSGKVLYDGVDVLSLSEKKLSAFRNRNIGFVFQFHQLLPEFTAEVTEVRFYGIRPSGNYEAKTVPGMFPGSPDRTVVIEGPAMITFRAEGIHEPK